jgi:ABC-type transport system involved in multi-copper enzyme maturation permease subunit
MFNPMSMLDLVVVLVAGIALGFIFRNRKRVNLEKVNLLTILVLIFSLGFSIGSDNELLASMPRVGMNALIISLLTIVFSVAFLEIARKAARIK